PGVAGKESEAIAQVDVDSGSRVEAREAEHAATRATQAIVDVVSQIVPASRRGQDQARALAEEALKEREAVLGVRTHGVLRILQVGRERRAVCALLKGPARDVAPRVLATDDDQVVPTEDRRAVTGLELAPGRERLVL